LSVCGTFAKQVAVCERDEHRAEVYDARRVAQSKQREQRTENRSTGRALIWCARGE
jgi:hypothetical protein